jgi:alpha-1,3-glucan synthase
VTQNIEFKQLTITGGLGNMPGWYYTVESTSAKHLIHQFKDAIQGALSSDTETRAKMRAVSAKQRFPVARWVEEMNSLYTTSIRKSQKHRDKPDHLRLVGLSRHTLSRPASPTPSEMRDAPGQTPTSFLNNSEVPSIVTPTPDAGTWPLPPQIPPSPNRRFSGVSITSVTKGRRDFALQRVDPFFTDADGEYTEEFKRKLTQLDAKTSETDLCIEQYLVRSEKQWFEDYKSAKFGLSRNTSKVSLVDPASAGPTTSRFLDVPSRSSSPFTPSVRSSVYSATSNDGNDSNDGYVTAPRRLIPTTEGQIPTQASPIQKFMLRKVLDWPVYTLILALGQILAANSYQISLLNGEQGQTASMLYTIASIYGATSILWWIGFRQLKSVWVLSTPFAVYGFAFILAGCAPFASSIETRGWVQKAASGMYAAASSSGSMFFALNFGDEGGAPVRTWVIRACAVQGVQQIYISALWYWGSLLSSYDSNGIPVARAAGPVVSAVCLPVAVLLIALSVLTFLGLPDYYRQTPGSIPSFFKSIFRRKLIIVSSPAVSNFWYSAKLTIYLTVLPRRGNHPKLLAGQRLRAQLAIPVDNGQRAALGHLATDPLLLRAGVDRGLPAARPLFTRAQLAVSHAGHWPRRAALGPDLLGHLGCRHLASMDGLACHGRPGLACPVAVARRARRPPGHRYRHDAPPDDDALP